jgi:Protein of unknown function (DUF1552)
LFERFSSERVDAQAQGPSYSIRQARYLSPCLQVSTPQICDLDAVVPMAASLNGRRGAADRSRVIEYLDAVRDVERRIQEVENENADAHAGAWPGAPSSVPDGFDTHVKLMADLQVLAFTADLTRVVSFKMGIDRSQRVYPGSGVGTPFHALSHHREAPEKIEEFARLNRYHVGKVASFLDQLRGVKDGEANLLEQSLVLYGSAMGDSHIHEHRFLPLFLAGHANGGLRGNRHVRCAEDTPMANVLLTLAHSRMCRSRGSGIALVWSTFR